MSKTIIHIGSAKAGSKFLQDYFNAHPSLSFGPNDFVEFNIHGQLDKVLGHLKLSDEISVFSGEKLTCPSFYVNFENGAYDHENDIRKYQEETAKQLAEWAPEACILFVTRGFNTVVASLYAQYVASGGTETYLQFLENYQKEVTQIYNYDFIYQTYRKFFDEDKILVLPFELLKTDKAAFLQLIENKFGIPHYSFLSTEVNKSLSPKHIEFYLKCSRFVYRIIRMFPKFLQRRLTNFYILILENGIVLKIKDTFFSKKSETIISTEIKEKEEAVLRKMKINAKGISLLEHIQLFSDHYC